MSQPKQPPGRARSPEREAAIRAALAELREEYRQITPGQLRELGALIEQARRGEAAAEALPQARMLAHRIRGTAGSYGWAPVGEAAGRIEDALLVAVERGGALRDEEAAAIARDLAEAEAAFAAPPETAS